MDAVLAGIISGKMNQPKLKQAGKTFAIGDLATEINGVVQEPKRKGFSVDNTELVSSTEDGRALISVRIDSARTLIVYNSPTYADNYEAKIATVTNDGVVYGPAFRMTTSYSNTSRYYQDLVLLDGGRAVFVYVNRSTDDIRMSVLSFSGDTITGRNSDRIVDGVSGLDIGSVHLSKNPNNDIILTYVRQRQSGSSTADIMVKLLDVAGNNVISTLNTFQRQGGNYSEVKLYTGAYCLDSDRILVAYTWDQLSRYTYVLLIDGISSRSMDLITSVSMQYSHYIYDMIEISENNVMFLSNHYDTATSEYTPHIGKFVVSPTTVSIIGIQATGAKEGDSSSKIERIDSSTFVHITRYSNDNPAIRILYVIDGVIQLGDLERIRPNTTNMIFDPRVNTLDGTAILVTATSYDGDYKLLNKKISIIDDSPISGMTVSSSYVDLDGVEKVAYLEF